MMKRRSTRHFCGGFGISLPSIVPRPRAPAPLSPNLSPACSSRLKPHQSRPGTGQSPPGTIRGPRAPREIAPRPALTPEPRQELAGNGQLTPGQIAGAARATKISTVTGDHAAAFAGRAIEHSSALLGHDPVLWNRTHADARSIDLSLLNTDFDAATI